MKRILNKGGSIGVLDWDKVESPPGPPLEERLSMGEMHALLEENGESPEVVEYLTSPPGADELKKILRMLGKRPAEILRPKEAREAGVDATLDDAALIEAMVANPSVIERPIVVKGAKAALGRPPEDVLKIL